MTDKWDVEERKNIFEPILFQGTENTLVDFTNRVAGDNSDGEEDNSNTPNTAAAQA